MSTTTIRMPEELKARIVSAAERAGKTTHSLILEAIAEKADMEEQRAGFDSEADARFAKILASGQTIPWSEMQQHLKDRLADKPGTRPAPKQKRT